jgi:hypothetical protein
MIEKKKPSSLFMIGTHKTDAGEWAMIAGKVFSHHLGPQSPGVESWVYLSQDRKAPPLPVREVGIHLAQ